MGTGGGGIVRVGFLLKEGMTGGLVTILV